MFDIPRGPHPIEPDPPPGTVSGLGLIVETTLVRFLQRVVNSVATLLSEILGFGVEVFLEAIEPNVLQYAAPVIDQVLETPGLPGWFAGMLQGIRSGGHQIDAIFGGQMVGGAASSGMLSFLEPLFTAMGYAAWQLTPIREPDISALLGLGWRGTYSPGDVRYIAGRLGFREDITDGLEEIARPRIGVADLIELMMRGQADAGDVATEMKRRGYTNNDTARLMQVARPLTTSQELQQLLFRGEIGTGTFQERLGKVGYTEDQVAELTNITWRLLGAGDVVELYRRGDLTRDVALQRLEAWGYPTETGDEILEVGRPLTGISDLVSLYWRGELEEFDFATRLSQHGYTDSQIAEAFKLAKLIPQPQDLIGMAVREAFRPDIIAAYNYLAEYPAAFGEWMEKQGYDEEWAQKYWVAHWRLPSLQMAYSMYHRRIITLEDLERLFATSDIAPFWRDKLREAAYQPLTRVDVRRMYTLGVLDREQVYESYLDLGYSPQNAELMAQFTERYSSETDRAATKADILKAYGLGVFSRDAAIAELRAIDYSEEWASFYLSFEDYKRAQELLDTEIDIMEDQYVDGFVSRSDVYTQLGEWNLPGAQIENYLEQWDITKRRKVALPSVAQLEKHLKLGLIDEGAYQAALARRHYESDTITRFLQEIRLEIATEAQAEEERAIKEELRVAEKVQKTEYEVIRADLDLQIAELKTAMSETLVLVGTLTDYDLADQLLAQNEQMALAVVQLQERKARAKLEHSQELRGMVQ